MSGRGGSAVSIRPPDDEVAGGVAGGVPGPKPGLSPAHCSVHLEDHRSDLSADYRWGLSDCRSVPCRECLKEADRRGAKSRLIAGLCREIRRRAQDSPEHAETEPQPPREVGLLADDLGRNGRCLRFVLSSSSSLFSQELFRAHAHVRHQSVLSSEKVTGVGPTDARPDDRFHCSKFGSGGSPPVMSLMTTQFVTP